MPVLEPKGIGEAQDFMAGQYGRPFLCETVEQCDTHSVSYEICRAMGETKRRVCYF